MTDSKKQPFSRSVLYRSAIFCIFFVVILIYLIWRGPPTEVALMRHEYLKSESIYYPLMIFLTIACAGIAISNIWQIIGLRKSSQSE